MGQLRPIAPACLSSPFIPRGNATESRGRGGPRGWGRGAANGNSSPGRGRRSWRKTSCNRCCRCSLLCPPSSRDRSRGSPGRTHRVFYWPPRLQLGVDTTIFRVPGGIRLFREATQLKTVGAVARVAGIEVRHAEMQAHPIAAAHRRRIAEPAAADAAQPAIGSLAEARGRLFRSSSRVRPQSQTRSHALNIKKFGGIEKSIYLCSPQSALCRPHNVSYRSLGAGLRPFRLSVRTQDFHSWKRGSIPLGATTK